VALEEINNALEDFSPRMEFVINTLEKIYKQDNVSLRAKGLMAAWIPDLKDIPVVRDMSETIIISNREIVFRMHMGAAYIDKSCLAKRTYSMHRGIKFNYSEWQILNTNQLN